jgi:ankyrin repeat protein
VSFEQTDAVALQEVLPFSKNGNLEATKALVERGAALNKTDKNGDTPLLLAATHGKLEIFRYLTEKQADINIRD